MFNFSEWSIEDNYATAYILDSADNTVDTVYQHIQTGEVITHSGKDLSYYGLTL